MRSGASSYGSSALTLNSGGEKMLPEDPIILLSVINTKLRDFYGSLDELCEDLDVRKEELVKKLASAGFDYDSEKNQFR